MSDSTAAGRKDAHLDLARKAMDGPDTAHALDAIHLPYCALPECDFSAVRCDTRFLGHRLSAPLLITGMTGGTERADRLNQALVSVTSDKNIAIGLGSQRANLETGRTQAHLRQDNPKACLIGNLGAVQIVGKKGQDLARRAVDMIEADALAVHLNPLQELIQPEGEHDWRFVVDAIAELTDSLPCPVLVKEVGAGLSSPVVARLHSVGVRYIDVAAKGGTNWAWIEWMRQKSDQQSLYTPFLDTGIALPEAVQKARQVASDATLIASGGLRHGLDAAKALLLGADMAGMAGVMLRALEDEENNLLPNQLADKIDEVVTQIKMACFLSGAETINDFKKLSPQ